MCVQVVCVSSGLEGRKVLAERHSAKRPLQSARRAQEPPLHTLIGSSSNARGPWYTLRLPSCPLELSGGCETSNGLLTRVHVAVVNGDSVLVDVLFEAVSVLDTNTADNGRVGGALGHERRGEPEETSLFVFSHTIRYCKRF